MNLGEMRLDVRERVGERTANFWTDPFITNKLNEAQRRFCREERWIWLHAIQPAIPVPKDTDQIELIDGVDVARHFGLVLYKVNSTDPIYPKRTSAPGALRLRRRYNTSGEPLYWYPAQIVTNTYGSGDVLETATVVKLVPKADQAYTAEYFFIKDPADLVADTDESTIPEAYQEAIIAWATAQCWLKELNGERKAQSEFNIYNVVLAQARRDQVELAIDEELAWGDDDLKKVNVNDLHRRLFSGGSLGGGV